MYKKLIKGLLVGGAVFAMTATANATPNEYNINVYGASAQHKFWLNLAPDFLSSRGCGTVDQSSHNKKHGIARGLNCEVDGDGSSDDTIYIRYSSRASYDGLNAINETVTLGDGDADGARSMVDEATCGWGGPKDDSCSLKTVQVNIGASDVDWDADWGSTSGWEDGNLTWNSSGMDYFAPGGSVIFPSVAPPRVFRPIVVPFAFAANDSVCRFICTRPDKIDSADPDYVPIYQPADYNPKARHHKAYSRWTWNCDPTLSDAEGHNPQCRGYFKCRDLTVDSTVNPTCDGGVNEGDPCVTAFDCPDATANTRCEAVPLNRISYAWAGMIFNGSFTRWDDLAPYLCPGPINRCMRHAGSGTHATFRDLLQPYQTISSSVPNGCYGGFTWHFTSSSDLAACVADFPGAIGYFDADKLGDFANVADGMGDGTYTYDDPMYDQYYTGAANSNYSNMAGAHMLEYNGVAPMRQNIVNGEYEFWASQNCAVNDALWASMAPNMATLIGDLETFASNPANITETTLGTAAEYWGAQDEMIVKKVASTFTRNTINKK
jgi:hypothetical protein